MCAPLLRQTPSCRKQNTCATVVPADGASPLYALFQLRKISIWFNNIIAQVCCRCVPVCMLLVRRNLGHGDRDHLSKANSNWFKMTHIVGDVLSVVAVAENLSYAPLSTSFNEFWINLTLFSLNAVLFWNFVPTFVHSKRLHHVLCIFIPEKSCCVRLKQFKRFCVEIVVTFRCWRNSLVYLNNSNRL